MKPFKLNRKMTSALTGAFYPTGYALFMFPGQNSVEQAAQKLEQAIPPAEQDIMHLPPEVILQQIGRADGESDLPMPSVGTEGHSVHRYVELARNGHHGLMVHAPSDEDTQKVMTALRGIPFTYGQKYHRLVMEDLESE